MTSGTPSDRVLGRGFAAEVASPAGKAPRVSIIMNCLDGAQFLREALDSVFAQTYRDWEVVFWDNGSKDESLQIAQSYGPQVRWFESTSTVPLGEARNRALERTQAEFVAFLDCDDIWLPEKLERQVALLDATPDVALVATDVVNFSQWGHLNRVYSTVRAPRGDAFRYLLSTYCIAMSSVVVRRAALETLGEQFDGRFHIIEEMELFLRLAKRYRVDVVDAPLTKWRVHGGSQTHLKFERTAQENELMLEKFKTLYPGFEVDYSVEVASVKRKILFRRAINAWLAGRGSEARHILRPNLQTLKFLIVFLLTYFPPAAFNFAVRARFFLRKFGLT